MTHAPMPSAPRSPAIGAVPDSLLELAVPKNTTHAAPIHPLLETSPRKRGLTPLVTLALVVLLTATACHNKSRHHDGGSPDDARLLEEGDLIGLGRSSSALAELNGQLLGNVPGLSDGKGDVHDNPCLRRDEDSSGDDFTVALSWSHCTVQTVALGVAELNGEALIEGSYRPDPELVAEHLAEASRFIPELENLLFDAGRLDNFSQVEASYNLVSSDGHRVLGVPKSSVSLLEYEHDIIICARTTLPSRFLNGTTYETLVTTYLDLGSATDGPGDSDHTDHAPPPAVTGAVVMDLFGLTTISSSELVNKDPAESVLLEYNGTALVHFTLGSSGAKGVMDLATGEVRYDG